MSLALLKNACTYGALIRSQFVVIKRHSKNQHVSDAVAASEFRGQEVSNMGVCARQKWSKCVSNVFVNATTHYPSAKDQCSQGQSLCRTIAFQLFDMNRRIRNPMQLQR